jgi:hypothetical protein
MVIFVILYDLCLLPARCCYINVYVWKVESRVQTADQCARWEIFNGAENLVSQALQFQEWMYAANFQVVQA